MLIHGHVFNPSLVGAEHPHGPDIAGRLSQNGIARVDKEFGDEIKALLGPGGDDHLVNAGANTFEGHDF